MPISPHKLLEITKNSQLEWYKNEIPITREEKRHYKCANPNGPVNNSSCPPDDPYCNCPAKYLQPKDAIIVSINDDVTSLSEQFSQLFEELEESPSPQELQIVVEEIVESIFGEISGDNGYAVLSSDLEILGSFETYEDAVSFVSGLDPVKEPTDEELEELLQDSKLCDKIKEVLGEKYLGCEWNRSDAQDSCDCPNIGEKYHEWLEYTRTYATFWNTPVKTPLLRNAQMSLMTAQMIIVSVLGDLAIRPGAIVEINSKTLPEGKDKKYSGKWIVSTIAHAISQRNHFMTMSLIRDSFV